MSTNPNNALGFGNNPLVSDPGAMSLTLITEGTPHSRGRIGSHDLSSTTFSPPLTLFQPIAVSQPSSRFYTAPVNFGLVAGFNHNAAGNMASLMSASGSNGGEVTRNPLSPDQRQQNQRHQPHPLTSNVEISPIQTRHDEDTPHPCYAGSSHRPSLNSAQQSYNLRTHPAHNTGLHSPNQRSQSHSQRLASVQLQPVMWRASDMSMDSRRNWNPFGGASGLGTTESTSDEAGRDTNGGLESLSFHHQHHHHHGRLYQQGSGSTINPSYNPPSVGPGTTFSILNRPGHIGGEDDDEPRPNYSVAFVSNFAVLGDEEADFTHGSGKYKRAGRDRNSLCSNIALVPADPSPPSDDEVGQRKLDETKSEQSDNRSGASTNGTQQHQHDTKDASVKVGTSEDSSMYGEGPNVLLRADTLCNLESGAAQPRAVTSSSRLPTVTIHHSDHGMGRARRNNNKLTEAPLRPDDERQHHRAAPQYLSHSRSSSHHTLIPLISPSHQGSPVGRVPSVRSFGRTCSSKSDINTGIVRMPNFTVTYAKDDDGYSSPLQLQRGSAAFEDGSTSTLYDKSKGFQRCNEWLDTAVAVRSLSESLHRDVKYSDTEVEEGEENDTKNKRGARIHSSTKTGADCHSTPHAQSSHYHQTNSKLFRAQHQAPSSKTLAAGTSPITMAGFYSANTDTTNINNVVTTTSNAENTNNEFLNFAHSAQLSVSNSMALRHSELEIAENRD